MLKPVLAIFLISTCLFSSGLKNDLHKCSIINNTIERIDCFDAIVSKHNISAKTKTKPATGVNNWSVSETHDPMTDALKVTFVNISKNAKGKYGEKVALIVRCVSEEDPEMYINWNSYLGRNVYVTSRFDNEKPMKLKWGMSTNSQSSFYPYPYYGSSEQVLEKFVQANKLVASTIPYNENPVVAIFDLGGFTKASNPYKDICKLPSQKEMKQRMVAANLLKEREIKEAELEKKKKLNQEKIKREQEHLCINDGLLFLQMDNLYGCMEEDQKGLTFSYKCENILTGRYVNSRCLEKR